MSSMGTTTNALQAEPFRLLDLPDEILLMVLQTLDYDSLLSTIHVNKHLCGLAQPFIYKSITVLHGLKAHRLSRSLSKDQHRPQWVRTLLISTKFGQEHDLMKLPSFIRLMNNLQDLRLETPDCNTKKPEDRLFWIALQDRYEEIFRHASVMINDQNSRLLPNLKSCTYANCSTSLVLLTSLGVLHFVDTHRELYPMSRYSSIFLHPTIESLTISCMTTDTPDKLFQYVDDVNLLKQSTALQYLHLEECDIHAPSLELILAFPRALKSLKLSEGIRYDGPFNAGSSRVHGNMGPHHLASALTRTCKDSLESLSLSLGHRRTHSQSINHTNHYLNLCELVNLKYLEVNNRTLDLIRALPDCDHNTWRRLPPSLETLKVFAIQLIPPPSAARQTDVPLHNCFITEKRHHGVPNLKKIIYSYEHYESTDGDEMNFNDLLMNLVYSEANGNPPVVTGPFHPNPDPFENPLLNLLQRAVGTVNAPPPPPPASPPVAPTNVNPNTAPVNPNINASIQQIQPPRFRWRTGPPLPRPQAHPELCRSDKAKLGLLKTVHDSVLNDFIQTQTVLQIDIVSLPHGFIPPYLFPEDKPRLQKAWYISTNPMTPDDFLDSVRRKREALNVRMESQRRNANSELNSTSSSTNNDNGNHNTERARSSTRFLQRLQEDEFDEMWVSSTDDEGDDRLEEGESETDEDDSDDDMEVEDVLETLVHAAASEDIDTGELGGGGSDGEESVYVDASTEVEMSDANIDGDEHSDSDEYC